MNQAQNEAQNLSLPAPVEQAGGAEFSTAETAPSAPEQAAAAPETAPSAPPQAMPIAPAIPVPIPPITTAQPAADDVTNTSKGVVTKVIEDKDLIDKAWVEKAKAIIDRTREDPHKQTEEMTGVKAQYLQENYNKSIKLSK